MRFEEEMGENSCEGCLALERDGVTKTDEFLEQFQRGDREGFRSAFQSVS